MSDRVPKVWSAQKYVGTGYGRRRSCRYRVCRRRKTVICDWLPSAYNATRRIGYRGRRTWHLICSSRTTDPARRACLPLPTLGGRGRVRIGIVGPRPSRAGPVPGRGPFRVDHVCVRTTSPPEQRRRPNNVAAERFTTVPVATALPTTPAHLSGLLEAVLPEPSLRELVGRAGVPELELHGPPATRPLVAAALARAGHPVLAVTATDREAGELAAELADVLGAGMIAELPSWETLPHERLSPRADTVGRRLAVLRRLAHPEESGETSTGPLRVVVTGVRSLIQPILAGLGEIAPVRLRVGQVHDFDGVLSRLADLAYTRVDMVDRRGEFAVRGGIVDLFP
ncbi:MAG: hypothetical protein JO063_03245, partial [Pseudonocardiales bacterium]|nr:hypothetical protein [Pseudonocardiales bacterium]